MTESDGTTPAVLPQLRLDELLHELQARLQGVISARDRLRQLLEAVLVIGGELDPQAVLRRIVHAAATLSDARYAALGVIAPDGDGLSQFVTFGIEASEIATIGDYPTGRGILGEVIRSASPLRLDDLTTHPRSFGFPANHPVMRTFLGVPIRVRSSVFGNLYLTEKRGGLPFDDEDEAIVLALAAAAGLAIANARLYDQTRQRERWLEATSMIATALLGGSEIDDVLTMVADAARDVIGADFALLALPDEDNELAVEATSGAQVPLSAGGRLGSVRIAEAFANGKARELPGLHLAGRTFGAGLVAPLATQGSARGVLLVGRIDGQRFNDDSLGTLTAFATQAAVVLEVAEQRRDGERLIVLEDRDRIARDLHDLVIQRLFATGMQLESAIRLIASTPDKATQRVHRAVDDLDLTIKEIRSTIYALHTQPGTTVTLRGRILEVVDAATEQLGFPPALRLGGLIDTNISAELGDDVIAVLREALSNVARHANARHVEVDVHVSVTEGCSDAEQVTIVISDDGVGLPTTGRRSGLTNLRERAEKQGGSFAVITPAAGGTVLQWQAPLTS
ncbi:two-component system sensor histidine kinase [Acidothermaceae bacterium B102]|nr:two-component system sensor histidine kinase [Acidothermaceae bacterium B102]